MTSTVFAVAPKGSDRVALTNQRNEVIVVDLAAGTAKVVDKSPFDRVDGIAWSPDGRWLVTSAPDADQWIFVHGARVVAVSNIARQFGGGVSLDGWAPGP